MAYVLLGIFVLVIALLVFLAVFLVKKMKKSDQEKQDINEEKKKNQEEEIMIATQDQLPFDNIRKGVVKLKNDTYLKIIAVSSVNTQLMENYEKDIVRATYAAVLNSLNFKIQFYKQSRLVDINEYIQMLETAERVEDNEFKAEGIRNYNQFMRELVRENSVQTKKDYIIISFRDEAKKKHKDNPDSLQKYRKNNDERDLGKEDEAYLSEKAFEKAFKLLNQRERVLEKQIRRLGISSRPLGDEEIFELFYTTYNRDRSVYQSMKGYNPKDFGTLYIKKEGSR